jgi:Type I phosphodiesterase / nucleotide pyrophosphatase
MMKASHLTPIILLELNEINFDFVQKYIAFGRLPNFRKLIQRHGMSETTSETQYEHLEPWIQWVTAHTGLSFAEHGIFRLGDIVDSDIEQIWELLEARGFKTAAVCPMNAKNRTKNAAFFLPDPWTNTVVTGDKLLHRLSESVSRAVNDNASSKIGLISLTWLVLSILRFAPFSSYDRYLSLLISAVRRKSWAKAQLLDELLSDLTVKKIRETRPDFTSLFLNAGAHIQHHYMFNSAVYDGTESNPAWLVNRQDDPVFEVYDQYDKILAKIQKSFPKHRLMVATGLHQDPFPYLKYYWRLVDHERFLSLLGMKYESIEPRMSRDFLVKCSCEENARSVESGLLNVKTQSGLSLFDVDNRGTSLFVTLTFPDEITNQTCIYLNNHVIKNLREHVSFVAIKNGQHNGVGYFIDTDMRPSNTPQAMPLSRVPRIIAASFGINWCATLSN